MTNKEFEINAYTSTLNGNNKTDEKFIFSILDSKFVIPIYQRPYSWTDNELEKFISDLFNSYWGAGESKIIQEEPTFVGTMQFGESRIARNEIPVIDGQQRLTTFLLMLNILKKKGVAVLQNRDIVFLKSEVFNGTQQENLISALKKEPSIIEEQSSNTYIKNQNSIYQYLQLQVESNEYDFEFDWNRFTNYLLNKVYFVTIITVANLSKTLNIFETINATGLDLNGSDIFKVRFFEYLTTKRGCNESVFNEISELYALIEKHNDAATKWVTDMNGILDIYRYILIAQNNCLPRSLYNVSVDAFYEGLFDLILNNTKSEGFSNPKITEEINLSISEIKSIIQIRYQWENREAQLPAAELSYYFIIWSRYSRYWKIIIVFLFEYLKDPLKNEDHVWNQSEKFTEQLNKFLFIYSIRFSRSINSGHLQIREILDAIFIENNPEKIIDLINYKISNLKNLESHLNPVEKVLKAPITHNNKHKNLICRLSAMLDEFNSNEQINTKELVSKIFPKNNNIDIEHIKSYHNENGDLNEETWNHWGDDINSLGNLVILDASTNRSLGKKDFSFKRKRYEKQPYKSVRDIAENKTWELEDAKKRKEIEVSKIITYLFS